MPQLALAIVRHRPRCTTAASTGACGGVYCPAMAWDWSREGRQAAPRTGRVTTNSTTLSSNGCSRSTRCGARGADPRRACHGRSRTRQHEAHAGGAGAVAAGGAVERRVEAAAGAAESALHAGRSDYTPDSPPAGVPASTEARFASGAARVTNKLADVAERARPKAGQLIDSARKGIQKPGPAVEAAVKSGSLQSPEGRYRGERRHLHFRTGRAPARSRGAATDSRRSPRGVRRQREQEPPPSPARGPAP